MRGDFDEDEDPLDGRDGPTAGPTRPTPAARRTRRWTTYISHDEVLWECLAVTTAERNQLVAAARRAGMRINVDPADPTGETSCLRSQEIDGEFWRDQTSETSETIAPVLAWLQELSLSTPSRRRKTRSDLDDDAQSINTLVALYLLP